MNKSEYLACGMAVLSVVLMVVFLFVVPLFKRRKMVKSQLRYHISTILDPYGCSRASYHYDQCSHICEKYPVYLNDVGYKEGFEGLYKDVEASLERYQKRVTGMHTSFLAF